MKILDRLMVAVFSNEWVTGIIVLFLLLALTEIGFYFGLRVHRTLDEARRKQIAGVQAAILGLFGLLLGFSFAMAIQRDETRRNLIIREANSIRTTYLRASLLPEPHRSSIEELLRQYIDVRIDFHNAGLDQERIEKDEQEARELRQTIWKTAVSLRKEGASASFLVAFLNSLNETIDYDAARLAALYSRVPGVVWLLLLAVAGFGCWAAGYGAGSHGKRALFSTIGLPLITALVIIVVADIDRPHRGTIGISQQSLLDLRSELQTTASGSPTSAPLRDHSH